MNQYARAFRNKHKKRLKLEKVIENKQRYIKYKSKMLIFSRLNYLYYRETYQIYGLFNNLYIK